jgi:hypothetical protein
VSEHGRALGLDMIGEVQPVLDRAEQAREGGAARLER